MPQSAAQAPTQRTNRLKQINFRAHSHEQAESSLLGCLDKRVNFVQAPSVLGTLVLRVDIRVGGRGSSVEWASGSLGTRGRKAVCSALQLMVIITVRGAVPARELGR